LNKIVATKREEERKDKINKKLEKLIKKQKEKIEDDAKVYNLQRVRTLKRSQSRKEEGIPAYTFNIKQLGEEEEEEDNFIKDMVDLRKELEINKIKRFETP
jgi:hypothetical protein